MLRTIEIDLQYQPLIQGPPHSTEELHSRSASNDEHTINYWEKTWIENYKAAKDRFGSFEELGMGRLCGINKYKPAIVIGSGPSLKGSVEALRDNQSLDEPLLTVSCLHNFGYLEDEGCHADYYLSLDPGKIVIDDVSEGRLHEPEHYWNATKGKTLLALISSDPSLFDKWQGPIYLFNSLTPNTRIRNEYDKIERMTHYISSGGNALGGCMYVAKAVMGSSSIIYVGADFCFSYNNEFHAYKTHYDDIGHYVMHPDVYGIPRKTWQSYLNFKFWFDKIATVVPGEWINASEGLLGAYLGGNIAQFKYMPLSQALNPYRIAEYVTQVDTALEMGELKEAARNRMNLNDYFSTTKYEKDLTLF